MSVLVTGGAGFIGSALVRQLVAAGETVISLDALTYAGDLARVAQVSGDARYSFERADICDREAVAAVFARHQPRAVLHLAAETHVDRSIDGPATFIQTNVVGTSVMLEAALRHWDRLSADAKGEFRFVQVSTDEVFGDLAPDAAPVIEGAPYEPSSPYSASKASADHLVRAWARTYGLPTVVTHCTNNYGPWQCPEKLIPLTVLNALEGRPLPIYGAGDQIRDWLYVEDHAAALRLVADKAPAGATYNIGGLAERRNIDVVRALCALLEQHAPRKPAGVKAYEELITFVEDRPGHDRRYALDVGSIAADLGWRPSTSFSQGLEATVLWSLDNLAVLQAQRDQTRGGRLGLRADRKAA